MSSLDEIAAQVFQPLGVSAHNVVKDAFRLVVAADEKFVESAVAIEQLEFASFAVGGLSAAAEQPAAGTVRSDSRVTIPLSDSAGTPASAGLTVTLFGPGDVRGIDPAQIVRRYPAPGTLSAEETVLAHIEFDRPELPWSFSAAAPVGSLRPWLTLIVVEQGVAEWEPSTGQLPVLRVPLAELPPLAQTHLLAHAQAPRATNTSSLALRLSPEYAAVNLSRLLSSRVLKQDTDYIAAVVPTTDVGVRGGLGVTGGTLDPAWHPASDDPVRLPVYDRWEFRTGPDGDFATLALRLHGVVAPYEVGRRFIDVSEPGQPLPPLPEDATGAKQVLRCALFSPTPAPTPEKAIAENATWPDPMIDTLRAELDRPAEIEGTQERTGDVPDLPILGPHIYAKLHRGSAVITGTDWFAQLNLSPVNRIIAGLGTRVVQRDQEQLMQAAWAQVGEVEKANRAIHLAQLAELLATRIHVRIASLQQGRLLQVAGPLATRVSLTAGTTLAANIAASATPTAAVSGAFRRVTRPDGPVLRRADAASRRRAGSLVGTDQLMRDFTRIYSNPDGIGRISADAIRMLDAALVSKAIDVRPEKVGTTLTTASREMKGGIASYLTEPSAWKPPQAGFSVTDVIVRQWGDRILQDSAIPELKAVRAQRVGPLAAELAKVKGVPGGDFRDRLEAEAVNLNNVIVGLLATGQDTSVVIDPVRRDSILRGTPIGTAVGRVPGGVRLPAAGTGRKAAGIRGLTEIDPSLLQRVTTRSSPKTRDAALGNLANLAKVRISPVLDRLNELPIDVLRAEMVTLVDPGNLLSIDKVPRRNTLTVNNLTALLQPASTIRAALNGRLHLTGERGRAWFARPFISPILAAPRFDRPMYQALNDYSTDWLVPGLGLLPDDDFVTVLSTNSEFMEAFFVGLSDEMGRELLWRNYPTDRRGTYFRRFWDEHDDELSQQIHAFTRTELKSHVTVGGSGGSGPRAVIVVKSDLVHRYPDLIIQVARNQGTVENPEFEKVGSPQQTAKQLFAAYLEPDVALIGVDLGLDEIDRPEWWILIAEHPTATRFDRPRDADMPPGAQFLTVPAAADAARYASARLHDPVRVAFQATDLVKREA
ncbi:hypothetical protein D9V29_03625 [Mycetocola manganoxydans]|uniref:Uncharacterized protein n=1 Tax=Mycetocola manganoxydans TaxID=699879 RepID=A0A3L6ZZ65_9MICO|nr:hypothetical protein [Mycetocola manganoxydans]RLP73104.1 hypothetical protein D9V29_03625 [Mycetocola manganoxydans]GHD44077.1 hypothetical protein GCM10008097_11670 [Mycetocola manganoxydans]